MFAVETYRPRLLFNDACLPTKTYPIDVAINGFVNPKTMECERSVNPSINIQNKGTETITSLNVQLMINGVAVLETNLNPRLSKEEDSVFSLGKIDLPPGESILTAVVISANGKKDEQPMNDTALIKTVLNTATTTMSEDFEKNLTTPLLWSIKNPDLGIGWERTKITSRSGNASMYVNNFHYSDIGEQDDLLLQQIEITNKDSAFLSFWIAASTYSPLNTPFNNWDTVSVLISQDCGNRFSTVYKKWGRTLTTTNSENQNQFTPAYDEWRKDSVDLTPYINKGPILVAFRNTTGHENSVFLDDIQLRTIAINPNLKRKGFMITPNPATNYVEIQFYPGPTDPVQISVYNSSGQLISATRGSGGGMTYHRIDMAGWPSGIYFIQVKRKDSITTNKIIKL
jgi:hypothetical protein